MFTAIQQAMLIGYRSAEVHKQVITENYKGARSKLQSLSIKM